MRDFADTALRYTVDLSCRRGYLDSAVACAGALSATFRGKLAELVDVEATVLQVSRVGGHTLPVVEAFVSSGVPSAHSRHQTTADAPTTPPRQAFSIPLHCSAKMLLSRLACGFTASPAFNTL